MSQHMWVLYAVKFKIIYISAVPEMLKQFLLPDLYTAATTGFISDGHLCFSSLIWGLQLNYGIS